MVGPPLSAGHADGANSAQEAGRLIAVDLGGTKCRGALADLGGRIVADDVRATRESGSPFAVLLECVNRLQALAAASSSEVLALVIGVPALIDPQTGLAWAGPNVDWEGFDLVGLLNGQITVPFEVDNDVNLAAIGHAWFGEGVDVPSFVTLSIGTGIGGAVVVDGKLVRGRHNAAGEIGYLKLPTSLSPTLPARFEDLASGKAIWARAPVLFAAAGDEGDPAPDVPEIFAAARNGEEPARTVVNEVVRHVAMAAVNIAAVLDPHKLILDGSVGRALAPYVEDITKFGQPQVFGFPEVVTSDLSPNATIVGAIARGLQIARGRAEETTGGPAHCQEVCG